MAAEMTIKEEMENLIKQTLEHLGPQYSDKIKASIEDVSKKIYIEGMLPKDAMGISDEIMKGMYRIACELYESGKFDDARKIFAFLRFLDGSQFRFVFSQALCYHRLKDYPNAVACYGISSIVNKEDPWPMLRIAECYLSMDLPDLACEILNDVIERAGEKPEYQKIKERALLMQKKIKEEPAEKNIEETEKKEE